MGPETPQKTLGLRALHLKLLLSRGANIVRRKGEMVSLSKPLLMLLLVFTILGRVGGQVALPDGKARINFPL